MQDLHSIRRQTLERRLECLLGDYEAANTQYTTEVDEVNRSRLERKAESIWIQITALEKELRALELAPSYAAGAMSEPDPARILRELQSKLPEIDFGELAEALGRILADQQDGGYVAALLLFQNSLQMGGEWCAARVREWLRGETEGGNFRHIPLEIQPSEHSDAMAPLRRLGHELGLDPGDLELQLFSEQLVKSLCGSLQNGSVVMIEFRSCDYLSDAPGAFLSVLHDFWRPLVSRLERVAQKYLGVKIIILLFVDAILPDGSIEREHCCTIDQFDRGKLLEVPLTEWTPVDISAWIASYAGRGRKRYEIERMAEHIHRAAGGIPNLVAHELLKRCAPLPAE